MDATTFCAQACHGGCESHLEIMRWVPAAAMMDMALDLDEHDKYEVTEATKKGRIMIRADIRSSDNRSSKSTIKLKPPTAPQQLEYRMSAMIMQ